MREKTKSFVINNKFSCIYSIYDKGDKWNACIMYSKWTGEINKGINKQLTKTKLKKAKFKVVSEEREVVIIEAGFEH